MIQTNSGQVCVYQYVSGTTSWEKLGNDMVGYASNEKFGNSVINLEISTRFYICDIVHIMISINPFLVFSIYFLFLWVFYIKSTC